MKQKLFFYLLIFALVSTQFLGCDINRNDSKTENVSPRTYTHFCFDTVCQITIYSTQKKDEADIVDKCFKICDKYNQLFNKHSNTSEVYKINSNPGKFVEVSSETLEIIKDSNYYSNISNGAFDITISPVVDLWDINNHPNIPDKKEIFEALKYVNYQNIVTKDKKVKLTKDVHSIDLGGIAKGYVADKLKTVLTRNQITSAIINLGGNILTIGSNNKSDFKIGIKKPFGKDDKDYSATVQIQDKSVVTSGIYERYFKEDGKIYHHILDPKTGYPCDNNLYSVTIISDASVEGDALSTATFVLGLDKGLDLINNLDNIYAIFITKDYKLHLSDGLRINDKNEITIKNK